MQKQCQKCGEEFEILNEDLLFYEKFSVPLPTQCFSCRQKQRSFYRNEQNLFKRKCSKCDANIISMFSPDCGRKVYCAKCWWADDFDPKAYGRDFDFSRSFFDQMDELLKTVPLPHMVIGDCENSDYTNYSWQNRNCYLISSSDYNEDCYYSMYIFRCRNCFECLFVDDSELCFECTDCKKCYDCSYLQNCQNSTDCEFCFDLRGCHDCLFCVGLRNKKYCVLNEQYSKEDYSKKREEILNQEFGVLEKEFDQFKLKFPRRFAEIENCENCTGDHLNGCKNANSCFDMVEVEDLTYCALGLKAKDCVDCIGVPKSELCYQSVACPESYGLKFCAVIWPKSTFLNYCIFSRASNNCFGCVSLHKNEYCILNKQYSKEEYEHMIQRIIEHMKKEGLSKTLFARQVDERSSVEWGEFFPIEISPFAYFDPDQTKNIYREVCYLKEVY